MFCSILALICPNLVAMASPLAPLKFWIAYLKSPTPKSLLYTQNLCWYLVQKWSYASLNVWRIFTIAGIGNFLDFCEKQSKLLKILIKPIKGTRIHGNTSYEPLTTSTTNDAICAGEQERQKVKRKKERLKNRHRGWQFHLYGDASPLNVQ